MSDWQTTGTAATSPTAEGNYIDNLDIDNWAGSATSVEKLACIQRAEQLIEKLTHDYFYAKVLSIYRNGNGEDYLDLNLQPDILAITEILVRGIALETSWYTNDANSVYLDPESATGGIDDPEFLLRTKYKQGLFARGLNTIKITGTYGWSACPPGIKQAAIILCRFENDETLYTPYDDVVSDKLADAAYTRGTKRFLTGIHEADKLIRHFIRKKPMLSAT